MVTSTSIPEVVLIEPRTFKDQRGYFFELYHGERYPAQGLPARFVQDNVSHSRNRVLRGMHYQRGNPQGKLVMALEGEIYDVAVDIRRGSPTFGRWVGAALSARNCLQIYIPEGFAHGFCVVSETATVLYKCTDYYAPAEERTIRWDDPALAIDWPITDPIVSEKDAGGLTLASMPPDDLPLFKEAS
ncbi:MAG TPA: dTDP-4-dehydrorhamnose 3,5-epimerase [Syntrophobacteraceae bacterium]|nr:dTDP-4-dehydrorhamnose 3,5-epimerase [Syntrophobacteraceae bacterium]